MIALDPDVSLFSRLSFRRHWRLLLLIAAATTVYVVGAWLNGGRGDAFTLIPTMFLLLITATAPASSVAALEADGLFDFTRLCARPPSRLLTAMVVGLTWPYVVAVAVLFALQRVGLDAPPVGPELVLLFGAGLVVGLFVLAWVPARASPVAVLGAFVLLAAVTVVTLMNHEWIFAYRYDRRTAELTAGAGTQVLPVVIAAALASPFAVRAASRRLARPRARSARPFSQQWRLSRAVPWAEPPELLRTLRSNLTGAVVLGALFESQMLALIVSRRLGYRWVPVEITPYFMAALPFIAVVVGGLMTLGTASQEIDAGTFELVRMTPQSPEAIAFGWFFGPALPMWIVAIALMLTFRIGAPAAFAAIRADTWWWLAMVSALAPAVCVADCLHDRVAGALVGGAFVCLFLLMMQVDHVAGVARGAPPASPPWPFNVAAVAPLAAVAIFLGAACGRVRRPNGPALAGWAAMAAIAAEMTVARLTPPPLYPRFVVGALPLVSSLLFVDRRAIGGSFERVAAAMLTSAVAGTFLSWDANFSMGQSAATGICAALSLGAGILVLEAAPPKLIVAIAVPAAAMFLAFRGVVINTMTNRASAIVPSPLQAADLAAFGVVFAATLAYAVARR